MRHHWNHVNRWNEKCRARGWEGAEMPQLTFWPRLRWTILNTVYDFREWLSGKIDPDRS